MNIIVVGNTHRKALVLDHLRSYQFHLHLSHDYDLPEGWVDQYRLIHNPTGCLRAFRGHQDALAHVQTTALVFEDDAVPATFMWPVPAIAAYSYLDDYDWISLHGREYAQESLKHVADLGHGYTLYEPAKPVGLNGCCMAYWIKKSTADRYREMVFDGLPCDLRLWQQFKCALVEPSPFLHDRSQGSLIDVGARQ